MYDKFVLTKQPLEYMVRNRKKTKKRIYTKSSLKELHPQIVLFEMKQSYTVWSVLATLCGHLNT